MTDVARYVQDHPYQMLYGLIGLAILLVITEIRHAVETAALRRAFLRPAAVTPVAGTAPVAPAPARTGGALVSLALAVVILGGAFYLLPLLQGQLGQGGSAAPVAQALTSGTYRGVGTSPVGSADLTLTLDLLSTPKRVVLANPTLGTFWMRGEVTPESGGTYLSGTLIAASGASWGTIKAHVTARQVTGSVGAGPVQWQLDLRR
ncbi:hypothetical protein [Deinococcus sp. JMULE3]|uniref:hypothetical protein n=1 Tax=Deinococcus sp. JMULE3 TaxID=2518341 RepID=UPI001576E298|nr:hypothetical protein [Deinococcus sp. JMULE3]NTX99277.1 hypothetical protein [Deinococcus sp. JMULE3]